MFPWLNKTRKRPMPPHDAGTQAFSRLLHAAIDCPPRIDRKRAERPRPQDA